MLKRVTKFIKTKLPQPKLRLYQYIELIGLFIVLAATTFQLAIVNISIDTVNKGQLYLIEDKLNLIWYEMHDSSKIASEKRELEWAKMTGSQDFVEKQEETFSQIYTYLMIFGSILLFWGRKFEMEGLNKKSL